MKHLAYTFLIILFSCSSSIETKTYTIGNKKLEIIPPLEYKVRQDQFSKILKDGQEAIEESGKGATASSNDSILLSIAKSDTSNLNMMLISHRPNHMIKKFGLKGFFEKENEFINYQFDSQGIKYNLTTNESVISNHIFYEMELKRYDTSGKYIYSSISYKGEIDNREVSFVIIADNPKDISSLTQVALTSKIK